MVNGPGSGGPPGGGAGHVYKWAKEGRLPIYKLGQRVARIRAEDLQGLLVRARPLYENRCSDPGKREAILKKTRGAWADNPAIDRAMAEINRGWNAWAEKS